MSTTRQRDFSKEQFWRRVMRQWQQSGLSAARFCRQRNLSLPSFYAWKRTLAQRDAEAARFVPVRIVPDQQIPTVTGEARGIPVGPASAALEVVLGSGRRVCIGTAFDEATLRRLLAVLEEGQPCY
jgi:hypothetical protein